MYGPIRMPFNKWFAYQTGIQHYHFEISRPRRQVNKDIKEDNKTKQTIQEIIDIPLFDPKYGSVPEGGSVWERPGGLPVRPLRQDGHRPQGQERRLHRQALRAGKIILT